MAPGAATALAELIKNAFDADAGLVRIDIGDDFITVEDNGLGMTLAEVEKYWTHLAPVSSAERKNPVSDGKRTRTGGRGAGRLSAMVLGDGLEVFTQVEGDLVQRRVAIQWRDHYPHSVLKNSPVVIEAPRGAKNRGTVLNINRLREPDLWRAPRLQEIIAQLSGKIFPFLDPKSFRVTVTHNGSEMQLGLGVGQPANLDFQFQNTWRQMTPALIDEVIRFWGDNKMLKPGFSSDDRARQVVWIVRHGPEQKIVGLTTADVVTFKQLNNNTFYLYRSILLPGYRYPGLASKIIVDTRDLLEAYNARVKANRCIGILTFVENPRFQQLRREAVWKASGMAFIGMDKAGRHIRVYYFRGAEI